MAGDGNNGALSAAHEQVGSLLAPFASSTGDSMLRPAASHIEVEPFISISLCTSYPNDDMTSHFSFSRGIRKKPPHALEIAAIQGKKDKIWQKIVLPNDSSMVCC